MDENAEQVEWYVKQTSSGYWLDPRMKMSWPQGWGFCNRYPPRAYA